MHNDNERPKNIPPYTPMSSLGHELGVMFAFLAACFVIMGLYVFFWRAFERREAQKEKARKERFTRRDVHHERSGIPEKIWCSGESSGLGGDGCPGCAAEVTIPFPYSWDTLAPEVQRCLLRVGWLGWESLRTYKMDPF
ncbi:hypothetical protein BDV35DRAFT_381206 [Aspergillus flavus]|uniref:DNA, SC012 n=3 Tax=Aspergillus subgen. Circumdati TaxID=2720871 RepID=Q2UDG7_ASPOR|nr:unnamed protein product [Aspergillus oryzae RIB40]EIT75928.1 hypothetical protein Ao3042_07862 [Aspergillus oryzae 3.042]KAB8245667.1 hypothetical protein BDV35DRAFT_381206 [Aspergillus flavus]KDE76454.1 hypothetical protein AO1008_02190 [Aspergillus oryzae 100-8]BAE60398.1 unnamed protein product [Aspergillus oryzae RIB40]|eukprot:EIT75928.1 hypothetical protein Ao3042_07862 [Aspergillus oryzae 3.042]